MKRMLPLFFVLPLLIAFVSLTPTPAAAVGGMNLYWADCSPAGTIGKTSTCASNVGANILVASFAAPVAMTQLVGMEAVIDLTTDTDPAPPWWHMEPLGCRVGVATGSFDFTSGPFTCTDIWAGGASGGLDYALPPSTPTTATAPTTNHARVRLVCAVPDMRTVAADGTEYYCFKVTIGNAKTAGAGACAGCTNKACIVLNSIDLVEPAGVGDYTVTNAISSAQCTWQGTGADCNSVPVHNRTWGQVKSLYR